MSDDRSDEYHPIDEQFAFEVPGKIDSKRQKIQGSDLVLYETVIDEHMNPEQISIFIGKCEKIWACTPNFKFVFKGIFQYRLNEADLVWKACKDTEFNEITLAPNWFEILIKDLTLFTGATQINYKHEARQVRPYINAFLYHFMSKQMKKIMCVYKSGPGHSIPSSLTDWNQNGAGWVKYARSLFTEREIKFDYVPWHTFPFFQGTNYFTDGEEPNVFPMNLLENFNINFLLNDHPEHIYKKDKPAENNQFYRFKFTKVSLVTDQLRLEKGKAANLLKLKGDLPYRGVYRFQQADTIGTGVGVYKIKVQSVKFPEALLIFALPKEVLSNTYEYKNNVGGYIFYEHGVEDTSFVYGDQQFFLREPNIGNINNDIIEHKQFQDLLRQPPFGLQFDPDKVTIETVGGKGTPFPHVYINFKNYGDSTRILPAAGDLHVVDKQHDIDVNLTFGAGGCPPDLSFITVCIYTDTNVTFKTSKRIFDQPYSQFL